MRKVRRWAARVKRGAPVQWARERSRRALPAPPAGYVRTGGPLDGGLAADGAPVDVHELARRSLEELRTALRPVPVLTSTDYPRYPRHLMVREDDAARVEQSLRGLPPHWHRDCDRAGAGWVLRPRFAADGVALPADTVAPLFVDVMRRDGGSYRSSALGGLGRIDADRWEEHAAADRTDRRSMRAFDIGAPIDVVYTWVDGSDPAWRRRFRDAQQGTGAPPEGRHPTSTDPVRFADAEELRHSLRSVLRFANWVRRIHIVTDAQTPGWLDVDHPRIHLVDHREIIGGSRFNSHAIEASLHRIPGLSEHYLYLNDDVFFGRAAYPSDFFVKDGMARFFPSDLPIDPGPASAEDMPIIAAAKNGRDLLFEDFGLECPTRIRHTVHPQLRSINTEIERRHPERVAAVRDALFRSPADLSIAASFHHWFAFALGRSAPGVPNYLYLDVDSPGAGQSLDALLARRAHDTFCLNRERSTPDGDGTRELARFLGRYFPHPAPWEKAAA